MTTAIISEAVDIKDRICLLNEAKARLRAALRPHIDLQDELEVIPIEGNLWELPDDHDGDLLREVEVALSMGHVPTLHDKFVEVKGRLDGLNRCRKAA